MMYGMERKSNGPNYALSKKQNKKTQKTKKTKNKKQKKNAPMKSVA